MIAVFAILCRVFTASFATIYASAPFYYGDFVLSAAPGFHDEPFDLAVSIPSIPDAVIYWTIDGTDPQPGDIRYIFRGWNRIIQANGQLSESGKIEVRDRTSHWQQAILASHSDSWERFGSVLPEEDAVILQGTVFRFRGFVNGEPVTEIITTTYIIAENANERFTNMPIISIAAPYDDFIYMYSHAEARRNFGITRRKIFNYEYFEWDGYEYTRVFSLLGSSSLGGFGSRAYAQRTINVHLSRDELNGVVTHRIFDDLYELYRFRLWNGGSNFHSLVYIDAFAQTASAGLNVLHSDNNLAIKFVNGEYWGFTTMREHTSNRHFVRTRTGMANRNIAIMNRSPVLTSQGWRPADVVSEGDEETVLALYYELVDFVKTNDMSSDYAVERLFDEFWCKYNFMDYIIANTFFNNMDWVDNVNNMRFFRAITPNTDSNNIYDDGKWRFILHDMDGIGVHPNGSQFPYLYELHPRVHSENLYFHYMFLVFNNPTFVAQFRERAIYVLENYFYKERLLALLNEFSLRYNPLLPEMYNRFAIRQTVDASLARYDGHLIRLREFIINRDYHYRNQLDHLIERLSYQYEYFEMGLLDEFPN